MASRRLLVVLLLAATSAHAQPPPPGPLPPPLQPPGNPVTPAKANLGKVLFFDEQLSSTQTVACATCHHTDHGGTDPRAIIGSAGATHPGADGVFGTVDDVVASRGVPLNLEDGTYDWSASFGLREQVTPRKSPSMINAAYAPLLFWDGRASGTFTDPLTHTVVLLQGAALESQSVGPPVASVEMARVGRDWNDVLAHIAASTPLALSPSIPAELQSWIAGRSYPQLFAAAFGSPVVTSARTAMAMASYERTLFSNQTPYDAFLGGQLTALTAQEQRGHNIFNASGCNGCHAGALLSDNNFHYIGTRPTTDDLGRFAITGNLQDQGAFRTPSLRNVELRSPYMHGGLFATLEDVVDFYDRGGDFNAPNKPPVIRPLGLTVQQKRDLVAFLKRPLTDTRVTDAVAPFDEVALYSESSRVPQAFGAGTAGTGGFVPQVEAIEPPIAGNSSFTVGLYGALGSTLAILVIDSSDPGTGPTIPETASFGRVEVPIEGLGAGQGYGSVSLSIPAGPGLVGATFFGRWFVIDPAADGGIAASPGFSFQVFGTPGMATDVVTPLLAHLYPNTPNPFNPQTSIRYELPMAGPVQLAIYDAAGHRIRQLASAASEAAGAHEVRWDGRDDAGLAVPSGVYLYRLHAGAFREARRAVLIK